jgi:hypothetical protein
VRPLLAYGASGMVLLGMVQIIGNQFGFDRNGFRVFVLCGAPRRDILLGKNLAFAPLALGLMVLMVVLVQVICPMRIDRFLATLPQMVSMYFAFCAVANCLAIFVPMRIASGSFKPANPKATAALLQVVFVFMLPWVMAPMLLPLGIELALEALGWVEGVPVCLLLSVVECVVVVGLYRLVLTWQGGWLQAREQKILEIVTTKAE